uniref:Pelota mRNA surveillance and ribosome rescue factor n=1 Tax=Takifugu rubripes TaxID=31033 RepID=A0A674NGT6_TAKRU
MKLLHKDIEKDNAGQVTLIPEEAEDMWHSYNLLQVGDSLRASTISICEMSFLYVFVFYRIFSSLHVSGEQLTQLSGVAAILRFPIPDLSEPEDLSSSDED